MHKLRTQLRQAVLGRNPLVYLLSSEEDRLVRLVTELATAMTPNAAPWPVHEWTCVDGIAQWPGTADTRDPVAALQAIVNSEQPAFFIMKELDIFLDKPAVARALRDIYYARKGQLGTHLFILSPNLHIPPALNREISLIDCPPPDEDEIRPVIEKLLAVHPSCTLTSREMTAIIPALKGLTLSEVEHLLHRVFSATKSAEGHSMTDEIFREKQLLVKKSGYLEFTPPQASVEDIGGLDVLKEWLEKRRALFSQEALAAGVPIPKGLLIMGVSGCGKSLAVKAISALWQVPMFRLDMNLVFSGIFGTPEAAFHRVLQTVESVAPAILWIDEIENAMNLNRDGVSMNSHILSSFLTWMQEKPHLVFIAATANHIQALPAEIIRKGRFDEVFFVDLPSPPETEQILRLNLIKHGADPELFDFQMLTIMMEGWNGAEIEQAVIAARTNAYHEQRTLTSRDLSSVITKTVPLSRTMEEQIKEIRKWAFTRATPASKYGKTHRR